MPAGSSPCTRRSTRASSAPAALLELGRALRDSGYSFTTVTPATHARVRARCERVWARDLCDIFGWSRPFQADALPPRLLKLMMEAGIAQPHRDGWRAAVRASTLGGQLYFHSAYPTSDADAVFFGPDTYRFARALRMELELMEARGQQVRRAADVGAGSGAGAVEVALRFAHAEVLALDINEQALRLCEVNTALAQVANVTMQHSDLLQDATGEFDLLVSNPPYLLDARAAALPPWRRRAGCGPVTAIAGAVHAAPRPRRFAAAVYRRGHGAAATIPSCSAPASC
jgi:methylase of polypeptide subunit release factors